MSWRRRVLPVLGLAAGLLVVWAATTAVLWNAASPGVLEDQKHDAAERLIFYRVDRGEVLRMRLPAGAEEVRLVTHLHLPHPTRYAPDRQYVYGVDVTFRGGAGPEVRRSLFTRTRQSKADLMEGTWMREGAFLTDPKAQVADERELLVQVPPSLRAEGGELELRYPGRQGSLLLRAYARLEHAQLLPIAHRSAFRKAEQRVQQTTFWPWEKLSARTQRRIAEERWERLGADGEVGRDYKTDAVYRTDFRLPLVEVAEAAQERLLPGAAAAVNVRGPGRVVVWIWTESLEEGEAPGAQANLTVLSADGSMTQAALRWPAIGEPEAHTVEVGEGAHTVRVHNVSTRELRFTVEAPAAMALGADPAARGRVALAPDVRTAEAHLTGPGCEPLSLSFEPAATPLLLRLDARPLFETGSAKVTVTMLDAKGSVLAQGTVDASAELSPFEALQLPAVRPSRIPCVLATVPPEGSVEVTDWPLQVAHASIAQLFLPPQTREVRIEGSAPVAMQVLSRLPVPLGDQLAPPYRDVVVAESLAWRGASIEGRSWHLERPANHMALERLGAAATLRSQVRLEERGDGEPEAPTGVAVTLTPTGTPRNQELHEPDDDAPRDGAAAVLTRLSLEQGTRVFFGARTPSRPELRYQLQDASSLGQTLEVLVDGAPVHRSVLRAERARTLLPPLPPGDHLVELRTAARGLLATLNRPPSREGAVALRPRRVYRADGRTLSVPVRKRSSGPVTVNIVLYTRDPEPAGRRVAISIDRGNPKRRTGVLLPRLTQAVRTLPLPEAARDAARPPGHAGTRWYPHRVAVVLAEDLGPGTHWLEVRPLGEGPVWARFFAHDAAAEAPAVRQWNRHGWEPEEQP